MAITSPDEFLRMLSKSKLLNSEQLAHAQDTVLLTSNAEEFSEILVDEGFLTPWQATQLLAGKIEFFIANYILLDLLGRGGMGHVFLARHKTMQRQVALKIISRKVGKDPASRDRFLSEARAAALLDHPNIVRAFDVDKDSDRYYIIMEYVAGQDLEGLVQQEGPLDFEFIVDCIRQAAEGLEHAHRRNLVHCDIKPSNLLLTETGTVKILDMGMARLLDQSAEDSSGDREGRIPGTVDYMAPEQAMEGPDFDHRADIYALGCTMFFLLTGRPPFDEGSLAQRIIQHQTEPPPDIRALRPETPPDLSQICLKMMAKSPADRFQSAGELAKTLGEWQPPAPAPVRESSEPAAKPSSTGVAIDDEDFKPSPVLQSLSARPKAKSKGLLADERRLVLWMAAAAVVLGALLVVAAVFFVTRSGQTEDEPPRTPAPQASAGKIDNGRPSGATAAPEASPKHEPAENQSGQPSAQPTAPNVEPTKTVPPPKARPRNRRRTRPTPADPGLTESGGLTASSPLPDSSPLIVSGTTGGEASSSAAASPLANVTAKPPTHRAAPSPPDPLRDLPGTLELPPRSETGREIVLGKWPFGPNETPEVRLLGGDVAVKAPARLTLDAVPEKSEWLVRLTGASGGQIDVARFSRRGDEVLFTWFDAPKDAPVDGLRNCLIEVRVGRSVRVVRLVKPRAETPLTLELAKGTAEKRFPGAQAADSAALRLVITAVDGLPAGGRPQPEAILAPGQQKDVRVFQKGGCAIVLRAKYGSQRAASPLQLTAFCQLATRKKLSKLSVNSLPGLLKRKLVLTDEEPRLAAALENPALSDTQKKLRTADLGRKRDELRWLGEFLDWCQQSGGVLHVHFQRFIAVDKHRVVLLDTRLSPGETPAQAPAPAPSEPSPTLNPVDTGETQTLK